MCTTCCLMMHCTHNFTLSTSPVLYTTSQGVATIAKNATVEASDAYLAQPSGMRDSIRNVPYDQVRGVMRLQQFSSARTDQGA